ncbi:hypothetical protein ACOMHN_047079 [Nucella lapillus]
MQEENERKKAELKVQIKEQEVLQYELSSLRPKAKVYRQQQNSSILFLSGKPQEMHRAKQNLDSLQKEYKELEAGGEEENREGERIEPSTS